MQKATDAPTSHVIKPASPLRVCTAERVSIAFSVRDAAAAELLITQRCRLMPTGVVLSEVLAAKEQLEHASLWPQFKQAFARDCKAQFKHSRLFVDVVRIRMSLFVCSLLFLPRLTFPALVTLSFPFPAFHALQW
eukprot:363542-Chlamydomonas_euryale.AAC.8